jgi:hypothetical protein
LLGYTRPTPESASITIGLGQIYTVDASVYANRSRILLTGGEPTMFGVDSNT